MVWFSKSIRKHAFIVWLTIKNRLTTRDKLLAWGMTTSANCPLCQRYPESKDHLFYECNFSAAVWEVILRKCNVYRYPRFWSNELLWVIHNLKGNSFAATIKKLAWAATIYHLWRERNGRIHENVFIPQTEIISFIINDIRARVWSFKGVKDNARNRSLCTNWNFNVEIFD